MFDQLRGEVVRVDTATGSKAVIAKLAPGLDNLAFDSRDRLFVSSNHDGFVAEVKRDGDVRMISGGGMVARGGIAVLPRGHDRESVFVADVFSLRELDGRNRLLRESILLVSCKLCTCSARHLLVE